MAKEDFCFTYYDGDAARDMQHMDRLCRGAYNDLVIMQRKVGKLTMEHIKAVLGSDFEKCWPPLSYILKSDGDKFYIDWVENSVQKMKKNAARQKEKVEKYWNSEEGKKRKKIPNAFQNDTVVSKKNTDVIPLENGNGNGNEDVEEEGVGEGEPEFHPGIFSTDIPKGLQLTELQIGQTVEFIRIMCKQDLSPPEVRDHFEAFKIQNLSKRQWYSDQSDLVSHFRNSLKIELKTHGTAKVKPSTTVGRVSPSDKL